MKIYDIQLSKIKPAPDNPRRCFGMDLYPLYLDTVIARWERQTGSKAWKSK